MGCILIKPDNSPESLETIAHLRSTGECIFDRNSSSLRLMPVFFDSRSNFDHERYYHSFVGEIACGYWTISRLRKYLWWALSYWLRD